MKIVAFNRLAASRKRLYSTHCVKCVQMRSFFWFVFSPNAGKYGPEKTPFMDTFHIVTIFINASPIKIKSWMNVWHFAALLYVEICSCLVFGFSGCIQKKLKSCKKNVLIKLMFSFYRYMLFYKEKTRKKLRKMLFISFKGLFLLSRYSDFCNFFFPDPRFKILRGNWKWKTYDVMKWLP